LQSQVNSQLQTQARLQAKVREVKVREAAVVAALEGSQAGAGVFSAQ
jgi:hypothetical protein